MPDPRPLPALLSQALVAFTVELDNAFEQRMLAAGVHENLSLVAWTTLLRFVGEDGVSASEIAAAMHAPEEQARRLTPRGGGRASPRHARSAETDHARELVQRVARETYGGMMMSASGSRRTRACSRSGTGHRC